MYSDICICHHAIKKYAITKQKQKKTKNHFNLIFEISSHQGVLVFLFFILLQCVDTFRFNDVSILFLIRSCHDLKFTQSNLNVFQYKIMHQTYIELIFFFFVIDFIKFS